MASSRTGTAAWFKARRKAINAAKANNIIRCPICGVLLDYEVSRTPRSAEPDHIIPYANGGTDDQHNLRIMCRQCNQRKGNRTKPKSVHHQAPIRNSGRWQ